MKELKHTPLPWEPTEDTYYHYIKSKNGVICTFDDSSFGDMVDVFNRAFICKAVNNHDKLVERLKEAMELLRYIDDSEFLADNTRNKLHRIIKESEALLTELAGE